MSGLVLRVRSPIDERLDISGLTPGKLAKLATHEIAAIKVGASKTDLRAGDVFDMSGTPGDNLTIEGGGASFDFAGAGLDGGTLRIDGPVGAYAGRKMSGGRLEIAGNAGPYLAAGLTGGLVYVQGSAGDNAGSVVPGERFGMAGGTVVVEGTLGARAGDKMRRGTIVVRGKTAEGAGTRMLGGTIWTETGFGVDPGFMMRRGTLIGPSVDRLLPTFADTGTHDLVILAILSRYMRETLGPLAPTPLGKSVRKIAGDMATIGRGEIWLPAH